MGRDVLFLLSDVDSLYLSSALVAMQGVSITEESLEAAEAHPDLTITPLPGLLALQITANTDQAPISSFVTVLRSITYTYTGQQ